MSDEKTRVGTKEEVWILGETAGSESQVSVFIESIDGKENRRTVGSYTNIIEAGWPWPTVWSTD